MPLLMFHLFPISFIFKLSLLVVKAMDDDYVILLMLFFQETTQDNDHSQTLARLDWELEQRKRY